MHCLQRYRQQRTDDHAKISRFLKQSKVELSPNGSSHPASQIKTELPPVAQILWLIAAKTQKTQKQQTSVGGWVLRNGRGQLSETGSIPAAPPATSRATNPRQHRPKDLSKTRRDIHLMWVAPSTTLTLWSLSRNWVLILKELRSVPPSSMCTLWTSLLNLSIPDVPFPVL